jgi:hypothetical protein
LVDKRGIVGAYIDSNGRSTGTFNESSTALYMDDSECFDAFTACEGSVKTGLLQRMGIMPAACPPLENLLSGDPGSGDIVGHYARQIE